MLSVVSLVAFVRAMPQNGYDSSLSAAPTPPMGTALTATSLPETPFTSVAMAASDINSQVTEKLRNGVYRRDTNDEARLIDMTVSFDEDVKSLRTNPGTAEDRASILARDAASNEPSAEAKNYAYGFSQYFQFEFPRAAEFLEGKSDGEKFLWFMGKAGNTEVKEWLNDAIQHGERDFARLKLNPNYNPLERFVSFGNDYETLSLEGLIWLRNFEKLTPPRDPSEAKSMRMWNIVYQKLNWPKNLLDLDEFDVFYDLYFKSHEANDRVPDFLVLDEDVVSLLAEIKEGGPLSARPFKTSQRTKAARDSLAAVGSA